MCGYKNLFMELDEIVNRQIYFRNSIKVTMKDKYNILINFKHESC